MATDYAPIDNPLMIATPAADDFSLETLAGIYAIQSTLIRLGYLDPPVDGGFGEVTKWALNAFATDQGLDTGGILNADLKARLANAQPLPLKPGNDLVGRIVRAMQANGLWVARHPSCVNIVYIEGMNHDGSLNDNRSNVFNDLRTAFKVSLDGTPVMVGIWDGTTEPGKYWTDHPMNAGGAFHIRFGQYKAWVKGTYHTVSALLQAGDLKGYRDLNKTYHRDYNHPVHGSGFGVHQHHGYNLPSGDLGHSSAGCLVGRLTAGHLEFMNLVLADPRHQANPAYRFVSAILDGKDIVASQGVSELLSVRTEFASIASGLPGFSQDVVDICSAHKLANAGDVLGLFGQYDNFFSWFNDMMKGVDDAKGRYPCKDTQLKRDHFKAFWDQIPVIFNNSTDVTALEFAALMAVNLEESNGDLNEAAEGVNGMNRPHPGLAYAFDRIPGLKQSYNHAPNHSALSLFNDNIFLRAHRQLGGADAILNRSGGIDPRWGGETWPADVGADVDIAKNGFVMEADFYKFRGRGVIQTTWRSDYKLLIAWLLTLDSAKYPNLSAVVDRWRKAVDTNLKDDVLLEAMATVSTNADWHIIFSETVTLAQGVSIDSINKNKYLTSLSRDAGVLEGPRTQRGSFLYFAAHINGGSYPDRVHPLMRSLARGIAAGVGTARRAPRELSLAVA